MLRRLRRAIRTTTSRTARSLYRAAVETLEDRRLMSISLVSGIGGVGGNGASGQAGDEQAGLSISQDGRYVVFASAATNLVSGDTNGKTDIFVKDLQTGTISLVSATLAGTPGNGDSGEAVGDDDQSTGYAISGNGRYVVFSSLSSDLVANDTNNGADLFLRDLQSGLTTLLTVNSTGSGSGSSLSTVGEEQIYGRPAISDDGRFVAFSTNANNLVAGQEDDGPQPDTFVRDTQTNTTVHLTRAFDGGAAGGNGSMTQSISADGRYVVFVSQDQILENGPDLFEQVYVYDTISQTRTLVSTKATGGGGGTGHSVQPRISTDGRHVVFQSSANDLVAGQVRDPGNIGSDYDLFYRNLDTGTTRLVSGVAGSATQGGNNGSGPGAISGNGKYIAFYSNADNLAGVTDDNDADDLFLFDTTANTLTLVSVKAGGGSTAAQGAVSITSNSPALSRDGRYLAFESNSSDLVAGDQNPLGELFVRDNNTGTLRRVFQGVTANGTDVLASADRPAINGDGSKLVFLSNGFGLPGNNSTSTLPQYQVYLDGPGGGNNNGGGNNDGTVDIVPTVTATLPTAAIAGEKTKASATVSVTNSGTGKLSGPVTIKLLASTDGTVDTSDTQITTITKKLTLKAGQTKQVKVKLGSFPAVASGDYFVVADVTGGSGITETSTTNNQAASSSKVTIAPAFVDLSGMLSSAGTAKAGKKGTLPMEISNDGNSEVKTTATVRLTITPQGGGTATTVDVPVKLNLKAGASKNLKLKYAVPSSLAAGTYTVSAAIDSGSVVTESDETNNNAGPVTLTVTA